MATVRNKTSQPVSVTLKTGAGFYFAPKQTRNDFPNPELDGPYFNALVAQRTLMVVSTTPYTAAAPTTADTAPADPAPAEPAPAETAPVNAPPVEAPSTAAATSGRK